MTMIKPFCQPFFSRAAGAIVLIALLAQLASAIPPFWAQFEAKYVKKDATDEKQKAYATLLTTTKCNVCHVKDKEKKNATPTGRSWPSC